MRNKIVEICSATAKDRAGAVAVEYGFATALVTIGVIASIIIVGSDVERLWAKTDAKSSAAMISNN